MEDVGWIKEVLGVNSRKTYILFRAFLFLEELVTAR